LALIGSEKPTNPLADGLEIDLFDLPLPYPAAVSVTDLAGATKKTRS
jgi:hypothetical protein